MTKRLGIDASTLREMYEEQELSISEIARRLHRDGRAIKRALQRHGIRLRTPCELGKIVNRHREKRFSKETLVRLYEVEQLSAKAVGEILGCDGNTVRKELRRHGIRLRTPSEAQQLWRGSPSDGELKRLYEAGLSHQEVAEECGLSRRAVGKRLKRMGVETRSRPEACATYPKRDFDGTSAQGAYLIGFRQGDLTVKLLDEGGQTIRVDGGSTKSEQIELIRELFARYGHVWISKADSRGHQLIVHYLNLSFSFLLPKQDRIADWILEDPTTFAAYLAGYVDAEGCFHVSRGLGRFQLGPADKTTLHQCHARLLSLGIQCPAPRLVRKKGQVDKNGVTCRKDVWRLGVYRKDSLLKLITFLEPFLKHQKRRRDMEKVRKNVVERSLRARQRKQKGSD